MKNLLSILAVSLAVLSSSAFANAHKEAPEMKGGDMKAATSCADQATEKKLAGAAKNSFMKKCDKDMGGNAAASCDSKAAEKKLAGAAKNSFMKKCAADAAKA